MGSLLNLDSLVFERIEFQRIGDRCESKLDFSIQVAIEKNKKEELYRVSLNLKGKKDKEYTLEIILTGIFSYYESEKIEEKLKESLIRKNTVAILMPYLRSQVSLLTAQPNVECVVLPPFNIAEMMEENNEK